MARSKNDETGQIVIRPPAGMRDRIKAAAEANNRSMNAEIVATLEEKYPATTRETDFIRISNEISKNAHRMMEIAKFLGAPGEIDAAKYDELDYQYRVLRNENENLTIALIDLQDALTPK